MVTHDDIRRMCLALPETSEGADGFGFAVANKGKAKSLCWTWNERVLPKTPRVPNPAVLAVRVAGEEAKQFLIGAVPGTFFTEPHYNGFPAVLVRLAEIGPDEMQALLLDAWRIQAPRALVREFEAAHPTG